MTRAFVLFGLAAVLLPLAIGQSTDAKPAFEIADVQVSPHSSNPYLRGPFLRRGQYEMRFATMLDLVRTAYGVEAERVLGGPTWLETDTFDVIAKVPPGTIAETARPMLQTLLADRFQLVIHNDTRPVPAYGLKAGKHLQLKDADAAGESGCKFTAPPPPAPSAPGGPPPPLPAFLFACRNMTMAEFTQALRESIFAAQRYLNDRVVMDETELKGAWDFNLRLTPKGLGGPAGPQAGRITLFDALDKLGLRLDPADTPMPVIVVDSVNQKPTENAPRVRERLINTARPTEFEVAELKASAPDFRGTMLRIQPGGRVNIAGMSLKFLIERAWDVTDDMLAGAPKWMDSDRYDIVAKAPVGDLDIDDVWTMLRALVVERFQLATHTEDRAMTAYTLVALKPKIKKADPSSRVKYKEGPGADGKDPRDKNPILSRLVTCQNMTMALFAAKLQDIAPGYIHGPVLDATGLEGGYDFTLSFSAVGLTRQTPAIARAPGEPGPAPASDPNGAVTLFEAVEKQLGLKLEAQKRPVQVLVIDHAEQKPTEN